MRLSVFVYHAVIVRQASGEIDKKTAVSGHYCRLTAEEFQEMSKACIFSK